MHVNSTITSICCTYRTASIRTAPRSRTASYLATTEGSIGMGESLTGTELEKLFIYVDDEALALKIIEAIDTCAEGDGLDSTANLDLTESEQAAVMEAAYAAGIRIRPASEQ